MRTTATLLVITIAVMLLVPPVAQAEDFGPICFQINRGGTQDRYEVFAYSTADSNRFILKGVTTAFNNTAARQAAMGTAIIDGDSVVWGLEAFPTAGLFVAAKLGGLLALSTLTGDGAGFHLTESGVFAFLLTLALILGPCGPPAVL